LRTMKGPISLAGLLRHCRCIPECHRND
jgi:hypothetical protein